MRMRMRDGKAYVEVTLRDVIERLDVSDEPILAEIKRVYEENRRLRELVEEMYNCPKGPECDECRRLNKDYACAYIMRDLGFEV